MIAPVRVADHKVGRALPPATKVCRQYIAWDIKHKTYLKTTGGCHSQTPHRRLIPEFGAFVAGTMTVALMHPLLCLLELFAKIEGQDSQPCREFLMREDPGRPSGDTTI